MTAHTPPPTLLDDGSTAPPYAALDFTRVVNGRAGVPVWWLDPRRARKIRIDLAESCLVDGYRPCRLSPVQARLVLSIHESWPWPVSKASLIKHHFPETNRERAEHDAEARRAMRDRRHQAFEQTVTGARDKLVQRLGLLLVNRLPDIGSDFPSAFVLGDLLNAREGEEPIKLVPARYLEQAPKLHDLMRGSR